MEYWDWLLTADSWPDQFGLWSQPETAVDLSQISQRFQGSDFDQRVEREHRELIEQTREHEE